MMRLIVQHTELSWCHTMDGRIGANQKDPITLCLQLSMMELRGMTNLKGDVRGKGLFAGGRNQTMEVLEQKLLLVGCLWVIAFTDIQDILLHVFLHHEPRTTTKAQSMTLSDGMEPQALMLSDAFSRLQFQHHRVAHLSNGGYSRCS